MIKRKQIQHIQDIIDNRVDDHKSIPEAFFSPYSREIELIFLCCRSAQDDQDSQRIQEIFKESLNWPFIQRYVLQEGLAPLVFHRLKQITNDAIPQEIMTTLSTEAWTCASRSLYLAVELLKILRLFETHSIDAIPFKGPVLTKAIYGDLRFRASSDLDIIIHRQDFSMAKELLLNHGFSTKENLNNDEIEDLLTESKDFTFSRNDGVRIELHWEILPPSMPFIPAAEILWRETIKTSFLNATVMQFPPEILFMLLCVHHGVSHFFELFIQVCDIDRYIKTYPTMDWNRILTLSDQSDCTRAVLLCCLISKTLLGTALPSEILLRLKKDAVVQRLTIDNIEWRAKNGSKEIPLSRRLQLYLHAKSRFWGKSHLIKRLLLTDKRVDRQFIKLPTSLRILYQVIRPVRLLCGFLMGKNLQR